MARKPTGQPNGRPQKDINWAQFEDLCGFKCTISEIASFFRITKQTLITRAKAQYGCDFATLYKEFSEKGHCSLRRNQFALSKTNAAMAIHLGKIYLNQKEVIINENHVITSQKAIIEAPDNGHREKYDPNREEEV